MDGQKTEPRLCQIASVTVETVLILPVVLMAIFTFLSLYRFLEIDAALRYAAASAGEEMTLYGFVSTFSPNVIQETDTCPLEDISLGSLTEMIPELEKLTGEFAEMAAIGALVLEKLPDELTEGKWLKGGKSGLQFWGSHIMEGNRVVIIMRYYLHFALFGDLLPDIPVLRRIELRSFTGLRRREEKDSEETTEDGTETYVYVTEKGEVYHTEQSCSYIRLSIRSIDFLDISSERNGNGGKYNPCSRCHASGAKSGNVYITDYGEYYHTDISCSSLKRTVRKITLFSAKEEGKRPCSKCSQNTTNDGR